MSVQTDGVGFCKSPSLKDTIHCVVYVLDACKVTLLSAKMVDKLAAIRKGINKLGKEGSECARGFTCLCMCVFMCVVSLGVPQLVLLTKVDEACPLVREDLTNIYLSHYIERMVSAWLSLEPYSHIIHHVYLTTTVCVFVSDP